MAKLMKENHRPSEQLQYGLPRHEESPFETPGKVQQGPYYVNIEERIPELAQDPEQEVEKGKKLSVDRRDFMRLFSSSALLGSTAACIRRPEEKVIPYVNQPIDTTPGNPVNYATSGGGVYPVGLVVKTREGRPVKIEGNPEHPLSQGATGCADQATLQALYHPERRKSPKARYGISGYADVTWDEVYTSLSDKIQAAQGKVAIFTGGGTGSQHGFYKSFLQQVGADPENIFTYEADGRYAEIGEAHRLTFGQPGLPRPDIRRSKFLVGVGADFLDAGITGVYDEKSFAGSYSFKFGQKSEFVQFESRLTLTGAKANSRHVISCGDELAVTLLLVRALLAHSNVKGSSAEQAQARAVVESQADLLAGTQQRLGLKDEVFSNLADRLLSTHGLVMVGQSGASGPFGTQIQLAGILANILIGAYGKTLHFDRGWMVPAVAAGDLPRFLRKPMI